VFCFPRLRPPGFFLRRKIKPYSLLFSRLFCDFVYRIGTALLLIEKRFACGLPPLQKLCSSWDLGGGEKPFFFLSFLPGGDQDDPAGGSSPPLLKDAKAGRPPFYLSFLIVVFFPFFVSSRVVEKPPVDSFLSPFLFAITKSTALPAFFFLLDGGDQCPFCDSRVRVLSTRRLRERLTLFFQIMTAKLIPTASFPREKREKQAVFPVFPEYFLPLDGPPRLGFFWSG